MAEQAAGEAVAWHEELGERLGEPDVASGPGGALFDRYLGSHSAATLSAARRNLELASAAVTGWITFACELSEPGPSYCGRWPALYIWDGQVDTKEQIHLCLSWRGRPAGDRAEAVLSNLYHRYFVWTGGAKFRGLSAIAPLAGGLHEGGRHTVDRARVAAEVARPVGGLPPAPPPTPVPGAQPDASGDDDD